MLDVRYVPAFEDNYIWLIVGAGKGTIIVDPGDEDPVIEAIQQQGLKPAAIFITHHHGDHTGGVEALVERYRIPVYGPARERIPSLTHAVGEGDRIPLCGLEFRVIDTPGHTRGHVCYVGEGALFCGDTLFSAGCGRLFEGTGEQMHASLSKLAALPKSTRIYCAHEYTEANLSFAAIAEPDNEQIRARQAEVRCLRQEGKPTLPSDLALELQTNPFLRTAEPRIRQGAEVFAGRPLVTEAQVFTAVRQWKDSLD